jgi:cation diffusion facilitator CzcD-associated flavoprotein CzcO
VEEERMTAYDIVVVGAGLSGLGTAKALRAAGREDFVVLERASELGGTWRDNGYPGCACDIPSVLYCYRDEPKPGWTRAYAPPGEIRDYIRGVVARHDLARFIRCEHELVHVAFDQRRARWQLEVRGPEAEAVRLSASVLISGCGALADPVAPALPGIDSGSRVATGGCSRRSGPAARAPTSGCRSPASRTCSSRSGRTPASATTRSC